MKINNLTIELMVIDINETVDFYRDLLNFKVTVTVPESNPFFVIINNGAVEIMLYQRNQFGEEIPKFKNMTIGGSVALYMNIDEIETLYTKINDKVKIIQQLHKTDYGTLEFSIEDCNGYVLMFSQE